MADQGSLKIFDALPNFLGSKRSQGRAIFTAIRQAGVPAGGTLLDPFMGGGSVALLGKRLGYRVLANDNSARSEAIGKALIENSRAKLAREDVAIALTTDPDGWYLPPLKQLPWPEDSRRVLASIARAADAYEDPYRRALLRHWMVKFATSISIYGQPRMTAHQRIRDKNWDAMTPGQVTRVLEPQTKPMMMAQRAAEDVYDAVFSNGQANEMHRLDAVEFLRASAGVADVVYLDPPYPDTEGYGRNYVALDAILENREMEADEGRFAAPDGWKFIAELLDAAGHVPVVVLSLGAETKHVTVENLVELFHDAGRDVDAKPVRAYEHLTSRATDKSDRKREYLLVGRKS